VFFASSLKTALILPAERRGTLRFRHTRESGYPG